MYGETAERRAARLDRQRQEYPELEVATPHELGQIDRNFRDRGEAPTTFGALVQADADEMYAGRGAFDPYDSGDVAPEPDRGGYVERANRGVVRTGTTNASGGIFGAARNAIPQGVRDVAGGVLRQLQSPERLINDVGEVLGEGQRSRSPAQWLQDRTGRGGFDGVESLRGRDLGTEARTAAVDTGIPGAGAAFDVGLSPLTWMSAGIGPGAQSAIKGLPLAARIPLNIAAPASKSANFGTRLAAETAIGTAATVGAQETAERTDNPLLIGAAGLGAGILASGGVSAAPSVGRGVKKGALKYRDLTENIPVGMSVSKVPEGFNDPSEVLRRTNKIRASRGLDPLDDLPGRAEVPQPGIRTVTEDGVLTPLEIARREVLNAQEKGIPLRPLKDGEVKALQAKIAREGMTQENKGWLEVQMARLFQPEAVAEVAPTPPPASMQDAVRRALKPGELEAKAETVTDALARARGTTLQAAILPGVDPSTATGAVLGAAGGYGSGDTREEKWQRLITGAVAGGLTGRAFKQGADFEIGMGIKRVPQTGMQAAQMPPSAAKVPGQTPAARMAEQARRGVPKPPPVEPPKTQMDQLLEVATDLGNVPRTIMSSLDISGSTRQAGFLAPRHRTEWKNAMAVQLKALGSESAALEAEASRMASPMAKYRQGLYRADWSGTGLGQREEAFLSKTAGNLPGVKQTGRAYSTMLNVYRMDVFDDIAKNIPEDARTPERMEKLARYVEAASGRGSLPKVLEKFGDTFNAAFFSPRFLMSIPQRHLAAFTRDPYIRREVLKDLGAFYGTGSTMLASVYLAQQAGLLGENVSVELSPTSSDWGKIRVGDHRYDIWGGHQQFARMMYRASLGLPWNLDRQTNTTSASGKQSDIPAAKVMTDFLRNKFSPLANMEEQVRTGKVSGGQPAPGIAETAIRLVSPLLLQELYDSYQLGSDDGGGTGEGLKAAAMTLPTGIGVGVNAFATSGKGSATSRPTRPRRPTRPSR